MKVLHVMRSLDAGGIGTFILNIYRKVDRDKLQFDFAITHEGMGQYGQEILDKGGKIYFISKKGNRSIFDGISQLINLYKLCKKNNYDVIHTHYYFANAYFLLIGKLCGIKKRVSHCHNTRTKKVGYIRRLFEMVSRSLLLKIGTDFLGCSAKATEFLYGKKAFETGQAKVLYNGIDYSYWDLKILNSNEIYNKYNLTSKNNIIFVGRYEEQKNPLFALKILKEVHENVKDMSCNFIGYGSIEGDIKEYIKENNMQSYVNLLPPNSDIRALQAVSKVMIAPSLWEGLSIAYIEAQKMETIVVASDQVPDEVNMGYCVFLPLNDEQMWIDTICKQLLLQQKTCEYNEKYTMFNVNNIVEKLLTIYGVNK